MTLFWLSLSSLASYLISLTPIIDFLPQIIALLSILLIIFYRRKLPLIYLISPLVCLIIFSQDGVQSPFFFLTYFLLFVAALSYSPATSISYSLVVTILLTHSLNSPASLIPLLSLLLVTPLVWFVSRQTQVNLANRQVIAIEETDFLLWLNLKFKTGISAIIDLCSQLQSTPLNYTQLQQVKKIRTSAKSLLNSSQKLTRDIDSKDENI